MGLKPDLIVGDFDSSRKPDADGIPVESFPSRKDYTDTMIAVMRVLDEEPDASGKIDKNIISGDYHSHDAADSNDNGADSGKCRCDDARDKADSCRANEIQIDSDAGCEYSRIDILCALGGRFDHTYANLQTLAYAAARGAVASIISDDTEIIVFDSKEIRLKNRPGWSLSVFSYSDITKGVTIRGTEYETDGITLTNDLTLGQSNLITSDEARISAEEGTLIVIRSKLRIGEHI